MKLQNLTVIFIIIILPIVLVLSAYIGYEIKTINKQNMYNTGLTSATSDAIFAFELNTKNDVYYNNAESKRSNIKAAIKTFENSLSNTCNLGLYNNEAIEEYIPAIVFGLYDGFYMYAPTQTQSQGYKHDLKNYVYYSEEIKQGNIDIVIRYTLDNYVAVSGKIGDKYVTKAGYLINLNDLNGSVIKDKLEETRIKYKGLIIETESIEEYGKGEKTGKIIKVVDDKSNNLAIAYYKEAYEFTNWFMNEVKIGQTVKYLNIGNTNDPEDENSPFVQHKREIMKNKIQSILNSSITAYSNKTRNNYKMLILRAEDWDKIYNNISVISFVQGINLGFKNYNHYCVINSTNNQEYVNPNLIYFTDGNSYHDIRCTDENVDWKNATGYKIGSFEKQTYEAEKKNEDGATITDAQGNPVLENRYYYKHNELACYKCINGSERSSKSIFDFMKNDANTVQKIAYYSALARERKSTVKLLNAYNAETLRQYTITYEAGDTNGKEVTGMPEPQTITEGENYTVSDTTPTAEGWNFKDWKVEGSNPSTTYDAGGTIYQPSGDITLVAQWERKTITVTFDTNGGNTIPSQTISWGGKVSRPTNPSKYGYTFKAWHQNDGTLFDFNTEITKDITIYAYWESKEIQIRYSLDGNIIDELTTKANVGTIYKPSTNVLNGRENYSDKILLGYTYNNGGKVNYNESITIPDNGNLTLNVVYVNNNSIKCEVSQTIKDKECNQFDDDFYTNTTGNITAKITSENSSGSPSINCSISGSNTSSKNGNTYTVNSEKEGTNTISASMTLSKDGVFRIINKEFRITVDRTVPVLNSAEYQYYWLRFTILANVTEGNLYTVRIGSSQYTAAYSYTDGNIRITGATKDDCYNTKIILEDKAGNVSVDYYIKDGKLQK